MKSSNRVIWGLAPGSILSPNVVENSLDLWLESRKTSICRRVEKGRGSPVSSTTFTLLWKTYFLSMHG